MTAGQATGVSCVEQSWTSEPAKLTARAALRLQACINAVELAIIANSIALDSVLKAVCTARVHCSSQR